MTAVKEDLQRLVADALATQRLSYREAASRADGLVSHETLRRIARGTYSAALTDRTLKGVALATGRSEGEVRRAAGMKQAEAPTEFRLPPRANRLSDKERRAVLAMIDALLANKD